MDNQDSAASEVRSDALLASMTPRERRYAHHFLSACEEGVGHCVPRRMRYRLREIGLMRWVGGPWFEPTAKLWEMEPALSAMYPDFGEDANIY